ncbi:MAG: hypothetical protein LBQ30_03740 [Treponema sp.]|jgi:hypothetical protein|nr:hypothetical protein [Treponema sp.]
MLVYKGVPKEEIKKLKIGDFFVDSEIVHLQKNGRVVSIITKNGSVFNAHHKEFTYNVFKKIKQPKPGNTP